jgi:hypothetical protein
MYKFLGQVYHLGKLHIISRWLFHDQLAKAKRLQVKCDRPCRMKGFANGNFERNFYTFIRPNREQL